MASSQLSEQTCAATSDGINLGFGPRDLPEPRRELAAVEELAFFRSDGAQLGARVTADRTVGVCRYWRGRYVVSGKRVTVNCNAGFNGTSKGRGRRDAAFGESYADTERYYQSVLSK